mmetsp:Transcript_59084/g.133635  ORF Transcript_59084/g.133635 Transcript_59084/m.133635 type:complete len:236 (-) Transcript_59084:132-839(-)
MVRNMLIAFIVVIYPAEGIAQLAWTAAFLFLYSTYQASAKPWRNAFLNNIDSLLCTTVAVLCGFLLAVANVSVGLEERKKSFTPIVNAVFMMAGLVLVFVVIYAVLFFLGKVDVIQSKAGATTKVLMSSIQQMDQRLVEYSLNSREVTKRMSKYMTDDELLELNALLHTTMREVFQVVPMTRSSSKRLFLQQTDGSKRISATQAESFRRTMSMKSAAQAEPPLPVKQKTPPTVEF